MNGVIDIGNTNVKCCLFHNYEIKDMVKSSDIDFIEDFFINTDNVMLISVNPEKEKKVRNILGDKIIEFPGNMMEKDYFSLPGDDRLANGFAAYKFYEIPVLIVDCGSAITVDLFEAGETGEGLPVVFRGGGIMLGYRRYISNLESFPLLPGIRADMRDTIGKSTSTAMQFGVYSAIVGGIKEIIKNIKVKVNLILFTGGDGEMISSYFNCIYDENLTIKGGIVACNLITGRDKGTRF